MPFSVHVDADELASSDLAAALSRHPKPADRQAATSSADAAHHGARDGREAARRRSGQDHAGRAAAASTGRSYAFRRS
jgi:hypothetical protein